MNRFAPYILLILSLFFSISSNAQSRETIRKSGDVMSLVTPMASLVTTLTLKDYEGLKQGAIAGVTTVATTYALKYIVQKKRPDESNNLSFPSSHTSISFTGAAFIQRRYGWKWGVPAYLVSSYVAWSRVYGLKHDWWDVTTGAAIGIGSAYLFTRPFAERYKLSISPVVTNRHCGFYASLCF